MNQILCLKKIKKFISHSNNNHNKNIRKNSLNRLIEKKHKLNISKSKRKIIWNLK